MIFTDGLHTPSPIEDSSRVDIGSTLARYPMEAIAQDLVDPRNPARSLIARRVGAVL